MRRLGVRARWAVPAGAVTAIGVIVAATTVASASVPSLPHRTAAQLIAAVGQGTSKPPGPFTATVQQTANLGLPQLPQLPQAGQPGGSSSLATGTQSITIWYRDAQHIRVAEPVQSGESDLRLNGRTLWLWSSKTQTATRLALPAHFTGLKGHGGNGAAPEPSPSATSGAGPSTLTPQAAASQVLKAIGPSTAVAVQSNADVAGRPAYQLALVPRSSQSLVGSVVIAIDASRSVPLRVEVFGRGSAGLVYSIGFTSLTFGTPAASNFSFTPPPGATVKQQTVPSSLQSALKQAGLSHGSLSPGGLSVPGLGTGSSPGVGPSTSGGPHVIGSDWLSVVATPPSPQVAAAVQSLLSANGPGNQPQSKQTMFGSSSSSSSVSSPTAYSSTLTINNAVPVGPDLAALRALLLATTPVQGTWGKGRLLQTKLLSVLITSNGQILAGAVTPAVLYADVAADAG
ncbi:MAG TPA: hypothetical protein VGH96_19550 [Streptosporangiaceae bacterium]